LISKDERKALEIISTIGCSVSLVGVILTILIYALFWKRLHRNSKSKVPSQVLMHLCVVIGMTDIFAILAGPALKYETFCIAVSILLYFFVLALFGWMLCEGIIIYLQLVKVFSGLGLGGKHLKGFCLIGWDNRLPKDLFMYNDVETNPGPLSNLQQTKIDKSNSRCCGECEKTVRSNQNGVYCDNCRRLFHLKCTGLSSSGCSATNIWTCFTCGLPQLSDSFFNSSHSSVNSSSTSESSDLLQDFGIKYLRNLKIGHLNINSLGGTKFLEITKILHENILDVLVIGETKLN
ncbi:adhesion G- coupled receptor D1-like, partial [Paramuricea clavata]